MRDGALVLVFLFSLCGGSAVAAAPLCPRLKPAELKAVSAAAHCYSFDFFSNGLKRRIPVNVVVPGSAARETARALPYAIFLHGRGADRDMLMNLNILKAMDAHVKAGGAGFLIFAPSGGDHYWMNAAISKEPWGDMVTRELITEIEKQFSVVKTDRALFGISMGGHGVVQLGLHHPELFTSIFALSPVFRREQDIWHPGSTNAQPHTDYDAFGVGAAYLDRSPRELCQRNLKASTDGTCLPFKNFRLEIGEHDGFLETAPDTRSFIQDLKVRHPRFFIAVDHCEGQEARSGSADYDAHSFSYWKCKMPAVVDWLGAALAGTSAPASQDAVTKRSGSK